VFREQGLRVCLAHDGHSAAQRLTQRDYRVVLVDMKLPAMHGGAVLQQVKELNPAARTILITGHRGEMEQLIHQALQSGAEAVCYKPFDVDVLIQTVMRLATSNGNVQQSS
jgi:DNA-binding NtrC family response regulator